MIYQQKENTYFFFFISRERDFFFFFLEKFVKVQSEGIAIRTNVGLYSGAALQIRIRGGRHACTPHYSLGLVMISLDLLGKKSISVRVLCLSVIPLCDIDYCKRNI